MMDYREANLIQELSNDETGGNTMNMTMNYEFITPEIAANLLETNNGNRKISASTVQAYVQDIIDGNWDESVGTAISIDANGVLKDGQHRLTAIVQSGIGIHTWVCRNVSSDGIYDNNRKRSNSDQISIMRADFDSVYKSSRYIGVARAIIAKNTNGQFRRVVTPKEIIDFTEQHKKDLDGFFLNIPQSSIAKISLAVVHLALFMAYMDGVDIGDILDFYDVLCSGMSTKPEEFPIIAYRNYLKDAVGVGTLSPEIGRCQYALKKYLTGSCVKRSMSPKELIYPFPWQSEGEDDAE